MMNLNLKSKKALICGSSQGMGAAIAKELSSHGVNLTLVARNKTKLEDVRSKLDGNNHHIFQADLSVASEAEKLSDFTRGESFDIVINNTGGPPPGEIHKASIIEFEKGMQMHLFASHQLMQSIVPSMREKHYGRFINIISSSVKIPIRGLGVSNTVRGAMAAWSKTLSLELAKYGITINNILPGFIETDRLKGLISKLSENQGKPEDHIKKEMITTIPTQRFGKPEEVAALVAFLFSPLAAYINGTNIPVDGGKTGSL